jgi:hypothetical protein
MLLRSPLGSRRPAPFLPSSPIRTGRPSPAAASRLPATVHAFRRAAAAPARIPRCPKTEPVDSRPAEATARRVRPGPGPAASGPPLPGAEPGGGLPGEASRRSRGDPRKPPRRPRLRRADSGRKAARGPPLFLARWKSKKRNYLEEYDEIFHQKQQCFFDCSLSLSLSLSLWP